MQAMFQLIDEALESKRKNIPDTPNYIFYRRLLLWTVGVPMALVSVILFVSFIRVGLFDPNLSLAKKGILASGIDLNAWFIIVIVFNAFFVIGVVFWFIKPRTEEGIKKALSWLNFAIGIVGIPIGYALLTYGGYQAGIVGLGFTVFSLLIVGLLIGLRG
jgi:hypothetical protein